MYQNGVKQTYFIPGQGFIERAAIGPPPNVNYQSGNPYSNISQMVRRSYLGPGQPLTPGPQQPQPGTLAAAKAQAAVQRAQTQTMQNQEILEAVALIANAVKQAIAAIPETINQAQQQRAAVVQKAHHAQRSAPQQAYVATAPVSPVTHRPSGITAAVRRSVGLADHQLTPVTKSTVYAPQIAQMPVSPVTGQPSRMTAMIRRSVGIED